MNARRGGSAAAEQQRIAAAAEQQRIAAAAAEQQRIAAAAAEQQRIAAAAAKVNFNTSDLLNFVPFWCIVPYRDILQCTVLHCD